MEIDQIKAMSLKLMSSVLSGDSNKDDIAKKRQEGQRALGSLLSAVQGCQARYGGRTELATEDDIRVIDLCERWTCVLTHGLRPPNFPTSPTVPPSLQHLQNLVSAGINYAFNNAHIGISLWNYSRLHLTRHEEERFKQLKQINTPMGHFRAFLRAALNERSLERYLHSWVGHPLVTEYYEEWALMRDSEATSLLPNMAAGLVSILFALSIDKAELNESQPSQPLNPIAKEPIIALKPPVMKANVKKKSLRQVISFDTNDNEEPNHKEDKEQTHEQSPLAFDRLEYSNSKSTTSNSAPPTCVNSPDPIKASVFSILSSQSEPTTSNYDAKKKHFFPEESNEKNSNETPGQILARLSEKAKDIFSSKKSLNESSSQKGSDVSSASGTRRLSESDSEGGLAESSVSCLELCFPEDDAQEVDEGNLRGMLVRQQDENMSLQLKITQMDVAHKEKIYKMEKIILDLSRENTRLKEQLKKYVSAVQMLKNNGPQQADEVKQYEAKLVQVAEMHAELMEFNEMLQRKLAQVTPTTQVSPGSECGEVCKVQVWIPSTFLISSGSKSYHVYQVFLKVCNEEWNVFRRYSEFRKLYSDMKNSHPDVAPFKFPPKKALGKKEAWVVERRRTSLAAWLRHLVLCLPQLRQASTKLDLVSLLPFFNDANNGTIPNNEIQSPTSPMAY